MPVIEGSVTRVKKLPPREGKDPVFSVSVEGIGFLSRPDVPRPSVGQYIRARVSVFWPRDGKPVLWLQAFSPATV